MSKSKAAAAAEPVLISDVNLSRAWSRERCSPYSRGVALKSPHSYLSISWFF